MTDAKSSAQRRFINRHGGVGALFFQKTKCAMLQTMNIMTEFRTSAP